MVSHTLSPDGRELSVGDLLVVAINGQRSNKIFD
jgi:hypothetical protein